MFPFLYFRFLFPQGSNKSNILMKNNFWEGKRRKYIFLFNKNLFKVFGICGGLAATYSAIRSLSVTHFVPPCYLSSIANGKEPNAGGHVNCCGKYQNISVFGLQEEYCSPSNLDFYN